MKNKKKLRITKKSGQVQLEEIEEGKEEITVILMKKSSTIIWVNTDLIMLKEKKMTFSKMINLLTEVEEAEVILEEEEEEIATEEIGVEAIMKVIKSDTNKRIRYTRNMHIRKMTDTKEVMNKVTSKVEGNTEETTEETTEKTTEEVEELVINEGRLLKIH